VGWARGDIFRQTTGIRTGTFLLCCGNQRIRGAFFLPCDIAWRTVNRAANAVWRPALTKNKTAGVAIQEQLPFPLVNPPRRYPPRDTRARTSFLRVVLGGRFQTFPSLLGAEIYSVRRVLRGAFPVCPKIPVVASRGGGVFAREMGRDFRNNVEIRFSELQGQLRKSVTLN